MKKRKKGITLLEVIVGVAILGMMTGLLFRFMGEQYVYEVRLGIQKTLVQEIKKEIANIVVKDVDARDEKMLDEEGDEIERLGELVEVDMLPMSIEINGVDIHYEVVSGVVDKGGVGVELFSYNFDPVLKGENVGDGGGGGLVIDILPVSSPFPTGSYLSEIGDEALLERMAYDYVPSIDREYFNSFNEAEHQYRRVTGNEYTGAEVSRLLPRNENSKEDTRYIIYFDTEEVVRIVGEEVDVNAAGEIVDSKDRDKVGKQRELNLYVATNESTAYANTIDIIFMTNKYFELDFDKVTVTSNHGTYPHLYIISGEITPDPYISSTNGGQVTVISTGDTGRRETLVARDKYSGMYVYYPNQEIDLVVEYNDTDEYTSNDTGELKVVGGLVSKGEVGMLGYEDRYEWGEGWTGRHEILGFTY